MMLALALVSCCCLHGEHARARGLENGPTSLFNHDELCSSSVYSLQQNGVVEVIKVFIYWRRLVTRLEN
jgi:hypothetical protein